MQESSQFMFWRSAGLPGVCSGPNLALNTDAKQAAQKTAPLVWRRLALR
jgi:hypothetical protein